MNPLMVNVGSHHIQVFTKFIIHIGMTVYMHYMGIENSRRTPVPNIW